jgi:hypothetical protein
MTVSILQLQARTWPRYRSQFCDCYPLGMGLQCPASLLHALRLVDWLSCMPDAREQALAHGEPPHDANIDSGQPMKPGMYGHDQTPQVCSLLSNGKLLLLISKSRTQLLLAQHSIQGWHRRPVCIMIL